ncbi:plasmid replication initiation protein [Lactobacillus bombicola]|uniref:Plasmid replication initiation protein n=2 Tax=Lactobacillus bombicola TaxID=1505723 RepID=A0A396STX1_9LACO|nr:plasmid replication initiation protein [Lactobacillus bombicola]
MEQNGEFIMIHKSQPYTRNEMVRTTFYQLPKVFFTKHSRYANLSLQAAVAFSFLQDRLNYSIRNNWCDENGAIYFIFTNEELCKTLKIKSKATVIKIKKELEKFDLLEQKRMGLNQPNRLYLLHPVVTAEDVYEISNESENEPETLEPQGSSKNELPKDKPETLEPQGSSNFELPENKPETLEPQGSSNFELYQDKEYLEDTNKIHTDTQLDFSTAKYSTQQIAQQNADLVKHLKDTLDVKACNNYLNAESIRLIKMWCNTPAQVNRFIQIILNAKNTAQQEAIANGFGDNAYLDLANENLQVKVTKWIRSYFDRIRSAENDSKKKIKNAESYLYTSMHNNFNQHMHEQLQQQENKQS